MKIQTRTLDMRIRRKTVGCGVQGNRCLALAMSQGRGGKWSVDWSLAGELDDPDFAARLARNTGACHFWVSPAEEGGLQVETARAIEIPDDGASGGAAQEDYFLTQIRSRFVNETVVFGGMRMAGDGQRGAKKTAHCVGGGAIKDNIRRDYAAWYSRMGVRRPHIASTALAIANAYLALYPQDKRAAMPLRLVLLKGRSVYRAILMDGWKYIDEVLLSRMDGDDVSPEIVKVRMDGWIEYFGRQHPDVVGKRAIEPLVISVKESHVSDYEHWDLWDENATEKIDMTESVAVPILENRDIAPVAFGMALQGGC